MSSVRGSEFAAIAYNVIVAEKKLELKQLAPKVGLTYDTLHARINGRVLFSADEICRLIRVVPDLRLINYFLEQTPYLPAKRHDGETEKLESVQSGATHSLLEASDVLRQVEHSLRDNKIDHRDKLLINEEIASTERALASLRKLLE